MFWIFILMAGLALTFAQLGAYSVLVGILSLGLKLAILAIVFLVVALVWRKYFSAKK